MSKCVRCRRRVEGTECPVCGAISTDVFDAALVADGGDPR